MAVDDNGVAYLLCVFAFEEVATAAGKFSLYLVVYLIECDDCVFGRAELYAANTMPGPPVAKMVSASCITVLVRSIEGLSTQQIMSLGSPAFSAASRTIFAALIVD